VKNKSKRIIFRVELPLYKFLKDFSIAQNQTISETIRNILIYFQMGLLSGEFKKSFSELKKEYLRIKKQKSK